MFDMSDLSTALQSTEKSCTFLFIDASLESIWTNLLDMLPRQNWVGNVKFLLPALD